MKKLVQPANRKVYGTNIQQESQINAVRKIHNLLSSGAVTVTGPNQQRILNQKTQLSATNETTSSVNQQNNQTNCIKSPSTKCYVCDDIPGTQHSVIAETTTAYSNTKLPNKIGQIIGEKFMVIVSVDDVVCRKCLTLINHFDRLENDTERLRNNILNLIINKYGPSEAEKSISSPPSKIQRLNSGNISNRKTNDEEPEKIVRKINIHGNNNRDSESETNITDASEKNKNLITTKNDIQPGKKQVKVYKCMSCEFRTSDLKLFQPHYETCRQQNGYRCKVCKKVFSNAQALKQHINEKHQTETTCGICNTSFSNEMTLKKHYELSHPDSKITSEGTNIVYSCNLCQYKTSDKVNHEEHLRKHKVKPFKCKLCSLRFETRDQASTHAKTHSTNSFKCTSCSASFAIKEQLTKHFETQHSAKASQVSNPLTQKLLQDTIDEALSEPAESQDRDINFFSCNFCSLTFLRESYYTHHMEVHKANNKKQNIPTTSSSQSLIRQEVRSTNSSMNNAQANPTPETDIEGMFEKMHSEKNENEAVNGNENLVITSQESSGGGITFNITIPQQDNSDSSKTENLEKDLLAGKSDNAAAGIDMPVLDQPDESATTSDRKQTSEQETDDTPSVPVSMPSLDDDGDSQSQPSNTDQVPMDLEEMQNSVENSQIKFILNENGQILQLDNHIITTDADGNQILVQGTDSEQIQQLLQSVGVLQAGDGLDGETLQMIGDNNQMIIVQQGDNEAQLIDASLLNADGHIVIQEGQDGDISQDGQNINEEGVQIPVSVAYTSQNHEDTNINPEDELDIENTDSNPKNKKEKVESDETKDVSKIGKLNQDIPITTSSNTGTSSRSLPTSSGETFYALEDLMQQSDSKTSE